MKKFANILIVLGILSSVKSTIAAPFPIEIGQAKPSEKASNQMIELLKTWGFETTECEGNIIEIQHDVGGEIGCAIPNESIPAGKFIYNSADNTISPLTTQQSDQNRSVQNPSEPELLLENNNNLSEAETEEQVVKAREFNFEFNNAYDYSTCLDVVLLAYEGRNQEIENVAQNECSTKVLSILGTNISKKAALELIESANIRATEMLANAIYPVFGIRRRVAINLGYVYEIDKNNSELLKLIE